ncbi:MAG: heparinase II/III family protein [Kiritimatiellae bacterium]|nr:heparinase II/III family protein [Kiritimatiellia bacterium]
MSILLTSLPLCGAAATPGALARIRALAPAVSASSRFPEGHPRLMMTAEEAQGRCKAAATDAAERARIQRLEKRADEILARPLVIPGPRNDEHGEITWRLRFVAEAALLTGRADCAERVRNTILAYAEKYPQWPARKGAHCRAGTSSLREANWAIRLIHSYDLLLGTGRVTAEERRRVEQDLLPLIVANFHITDYDPRPDLHFRCYNFQAFHLAAVGLAALLLEDADLLEWTVNGPYGFRHLLAHDIRDDGLWWERSLGYHDYALSGIWCLTEAARNCNVDLYALEVPDRVFRDEDSNYEVDGDNGPKSLRLMIEAPFFFAFPDRSFAAVADSGRGPLKRGRLRGAAKRMPHPRLDWLVARTESLESGLEEAARHPEFAAPPPPVHRFANNGLFARGSSLFPSSGFAILRAHEALPWLQPRDTLCVNFNYGPHGGGHGHPDRLSVVLYALGRQWIPDFGSCPYGSQLKREWTSQTVSHNTVVVDGISQYPTGDRAVSWPADTPQRKAMGRLRLFHSSPLLRVASAECDTVYDGVRLERTIAVAGRCGVDVFRADSQDEHVYDYVLHIDGEPDSLPGLTPAQGTLGTKAGYQHINGLSRGTIGSAWQGVWKAPEGRLRVSVLPDAPTELIAGRSITKAADETMPLLIARRKARSTRFVSAFAPVRDGTQEPEIRRLDEPAAGTRTDGQAFEIKDGRNHDLLVLRDGADWSVQGLTSDARAALLRTTPDGRELSLAGVTRFGGAGLTLACETAADLHLSRAGQGDWRVLNVGTAPARLTLNGRELRLAPANGE